MESEQKGISWSHAKVLPDIYNSNTRFIVFDTETSGLNCKVNHILELAAVEMHKGKITGQQFHIYIKPRHTIPHEVTSINHIQQDLFDKCYEEYYLEEKEQMIAFLKFVGNDSVLFGHNVPFDYYFLNNELKYLGLPGIPVSRFRCTLRIMKDVFGKVFNGEQKFSFKLQNCVKLFKICNQEEMFHNALFDSFSTAKLIVKIYQFVNGKITLKELDVPEGVMIKKNIKNENVKSIEGCKDNVICDNKENSNKKEKSYNNINDIDENELLIMKNKMKQLSLKSGSNSNIQDK